MRFTLTYTGELRAKARPDHKHALRKAFHVQLRNLWRQQPLVDHQDWFNGFNPKMPFSLKREVGPFKFIPLVSPDIHLVCDLKIFMLRPEPPGAIITQGGDIDNRLKTLFDALRYPKNESELPSGASPDDDEDPFFCLLEDDLLISGVSVKTDRLLTHHQSTSNVQLHIQVETLPTQIRVGNRVTGAFSLL